MEEDVPKLKKLTWLQAIRKSSVGPRNCRFAALHSLFKFIANRELLTAAQCAAVLGIPTQQTAERRVRRWQMKGMVHAVSRQSRHECEDQSDRDYVKYTDPERAMSTSALQDFVSYPPWRSTFAPPNFNLFVHEKNSYCGIPTCLARRPCLITATKTEMNKTRSTVPYIGIESGRRHIGSPRS